MKFRKVDWIFVVAALGVVIGVSLLPTPKDRNPAIPRNAEHQSVTTEKACVACHTADAVRPLPARHPKRPDCFRCHARGESGDGRKTSLVQVMEYVEPPLTTLPMAGAQRLRSGRKA